MKKNLKIIGTGILAGFFVFCGAVLGTNEEVIAEGYGITLSPMNQSVIIDPGDSREVSFLIANPSSSSESLRYELSVEPFYISEKSDIYYEAEGNSAEMMNWVSFNTPTTGELAMNESKTISFTINVPNSAPAGGQYIAIIVTMKNNEENQKSIQDASGKDSAVNIKEVKRIAHLIYAEVTGDVKRGGEVLDVSVPSFLFSGKITGSSTVKNTGNIHGTANYTLQVYPLFSNEEVYTNVESPDTKKILPERSVYRELAWEETPSIGIFNVVYTVEFEGSKAEVSKMVIICPLWLLFVILFIVILIIGWIFFRVKSRGKSRRD